MYTVTTLNVTNKTNTLYLILNHKRLCDDGLTGKDMLHHNVEISGSILTRVSIIMAYQAETCRMMHHNA